MKISNRVLLVVPLVLLLVLETVTPMPTASAPLDDQSLFSKLQKCFSVSGMAELDAPVEEAADKVPTVAHRRQILQTFLDCCSKEDFEGLESLEVTKQNTGSSDLSVQLKQLQQKIQTIYKKYLMGSSVGLNMHSSA